MGVIAFFNSEGDGQKWRTLPRRRQVRNGEPTNDLVFSAYVDNNADVFPHILNLYVPAGSTVADVTFGKGVFWRNVPADRYILRPSDLN